MELREVFEPIVNFLKNLQKKDKESASKDKAKERLQLVLMQDRASVSPDFFEMMKKEIIEVIKKYIEIDEESLEVQLTRGFEDGDGTGPALYANIPIKNIKPVAKKVEEKEEEEAAATEMIANSEIIKEDKKEEKANIEKIGQNENTEKKDAEKTQETEKIVEEQFNRNNLEKEEMIENKIENTSENKEEQVKDKFEEVKEGVSETIEKVKKTAKDGIKRIKTKTQKKKINE